MDFEFYAQYGDISTTTPWKRPTLMSVTDWWKEFSFEVGLEDYTVWLVGSFVERTLGVYNGFPNDLDVILMGDITSEKRLKHLMDRAVEIGFEKRVLIDIVWSSHIVAMMDDFEPYAYIRSSKSFIKSMKDDVYQKNFTADEEYTLSNGLTQYVWYEPSPAYKKVQERKNLGLYAGVMLEARDFFE